MDGTGKCRRTYRPAQRGYCMTDKNMIIEKLSEALEPLPYVYAFWLEGADAAGTADEYSDIDFWVDFEDDYEEQAYEAVENALSGLSEIDYKYIIVVCIISSRRFFISGKNRDFTPNTQNVN